MAYRKAKCIELHDASIAFAQYDDSYSFTYLPGRIEHPTRPAFKISLFDLAKISDIFGFSPDLEHPIRLKHYAVTGVTHQTMADDLQVGEKKHESVVKYGDYEINIFRRYEDVGGETGDFEIALLEAEIQTANLINIRIGLKWSNGKDVDISEMSYSGTFTVWWAARDDGPKDD